MSADKIEVEGTITNAHPGELFSVEADYGGRKFAVLARPSGRLHLNRIRLTGGDRVRVELSPYDLSRGRITYRVQ